MYKITVFSKNDGSSIKALFKDLLNKNDKSSKLKRNKINDYIRLLKDHGLSLREPYIKKIGDGIWELRPLQYRILFTIINDEIILLHYFIKNTQKTPIKEIEKAKNEIEAFKKEINYE